MTKAVLFLLLHMITSLATESIPGETVQENSSIDPHAVLELLESNQMRFTQKPTLKLAQKQKKKEQTQ